MSIPRTLSPAQRLGLDVFCLVGAVPVISGGIGMSLACQDAKAATFPQIQIDEARRAEAATGIDLVTDLRAARASGVEIAPAVRDRADEVME